MYNSSEYPVLDHEKLFENDYSQYAIPKQYFSSGNWLCFKIKLWINAIIYTLQQMGTIRCSEWYTYTCT